MTVRGIGVDLVPIPRMRAVIARSFERVVLIRQANLGPAAARNAGLDRATGDFFAFLDAADRMAPGRLTTQLRHLETHPGTGCVIMGQELILEAGMTVPDWLRPMHTPDELANMPVMSATIRRAASEEVGGFDEGFPLYAEELDIATRLRAAGWTVLFTLAVEVLHAVGVSTGGEGRPHRLVVMHSASLYRYYRLHRAPGWRRVTLPPAWLALRARAEIAWLIGRLRR